MNLYLITGTTKGLGAALRDELARDVDNVVICLSRAPSHDGEPANIYVDLADIASIAPAFSVIESRIAGKRWRRAALLNNAGVVGPVDSFDRLDPLAIANNINVNLVAPMVLQGLFANATRDCADTRLVVNISSGAAKRAIAGWSAYCAAKAGLEMATRTAAFSIDNGLTICSLAPGVVDTPMQAEVRALNESAFPDVVRFRAMKIDRVLREAGDVARDIVKLIKENKLTHGGNFDIRELTA